MTTRVSIPGLDAEKIEAYLKSVLGPGVTLLDLTPLDAAKDVKGFGYGVPVRVDYQAAGGERRSAVLHTMSPGPFGHEHMAGPRPDSAVVASGVQPASAARAVAGCGRVRTGRTALISLGRVEEFCLLTEYAAGARLRSGPGAAAQLRRCDGVWISTAPMRFATTWSVYTPCPAAIRICMSAATVSWSATASASWGLADSYPPHPLFTPAVLESIEHRAVRWRWRLKGRTHRLRQVHGDFHPWNILFRRRHGFPAAGSIARRVWRSGRRCHLPHVELRFLLAAAQPAVGGRLSRSCSNGSGSDIWTRPVIGEILEVAAPFFAFPGAGDGQPGLVSGDARSRAAESCCRSSWQCWTKRNSIPRRSTLTVEHNEAFAVWITGLPASG